MSEQIDAARSMLKKEGYTVDAMAKFYAEYADKPLEEARKMIKGLYSYIDSIEEDNNIGLTMTDRIRGQTALGIFYTLEVMSEDMHKE